MAQINFKHAPEGCTPGERVVFNRLKQYLADDYFVWFEPTLFDKKMTARPDFVVLGSCIGLVIIEVKDWSINSIHSANKDTFEIFQGRTIVTRSNPQRQVMQHKDALADEILRYGSTNPDKYQSLLASEGPYKGKLAAPLSVLIAFPNITRSQWQSSKLQLYHVVNEKQVLLQDDLKDSLQERLVQASVFKSSLSQQQVNTLRWMLYPEMRVPWSDGKVLDPEQTHVALLDVYLPPEAQGIAKKPQAKLVRGAVGSGKTLILLNRAKFISEQSLTWQTLVLTYNKSLMSYMRQAFQQIGGSLDRVEIVNFHKWCHDLLSPHGLFDSPQSESSQLGLIRNVLNQTNADAFTPEFLREEFDWIKECLYYKSWEDYLDPQKVKRVGRGRGLGGDEAQKRQVIYGIFRRYQKQLENIKSCDWADIPVRVLKAIDEGRIPREQYHAILIDEAQDFAPSWFRVTFAMVNPATNMIFIVGDGAQRIYRRDFTWKELGLAITSQNSFVLKRSYRSTREIIDVALEVIRDSPTLAAELQNSGDGIVEPDDMYTKFRHGPVPVLFSFGSPEKEYEGIAGEILSLLQQGYLPKDIAILQRHRNDGARVAQELCRCGIPCNVVHSDLDIAVPVVKICTFHSAKGLEFQVVFICGLEKFKVDEPVDTQSEDFQELLDQERKLLYVGMTRARERLYITYSGAGPDWIVERIKHRLGEMRPGEMEH